MVRRRALRLAAVAAASLPAAAVLVGCGGSSSAGGCPLTGRAPGAGEQPGRVALAVKVDNAQEARPQAGLDRADVVVEETVEGGLTRLFAVFQCDSAPSVGPVRSARTTDGSLLRLLDGSVFAYSGANPKAIAQVAAVGHAALVSYDQHSSLFQRSPSRAAPHDVFAATAPLVRAGLAKDGSLDAPPALFSYDRSPPRAPRAGSVDLAWSSAATAGWSWTGHGWLRAQNGSPDVLADGSQVDVANVVVLRVRTRDTGLHDVLGNPSPEDVVTGSGKLWVLRDGRVVTGTWSRPDLGSGLTLRDDAGHDIALAPGRTWVELLPASGTIAVHP